MQITFKHLSLNDQKKYSDVAEKVRQAKRDFINSTPEETEKKLSELKSIWEEFVGATVEKVDGVDIHDIQNIDMAEVLFSFFGNVLIVPK